MLSFSIHSQLPFGCLQRSAQGAVEQQHDDKIPHAVHGIVGKAAEPPAQAKAGVFATRYTAAHRPPKHRP